MGSYSFRDIEEMVRDQRAGVEGYCLGVNSRLCSLPPLFLTLSGSG